MSEIDALRAEQAALQALKKAQYKMACEQGIIWDIATVARQLGSDPAGPGRTSTYGPKYRWTEGDVTIYVDDYGHYMTVHAAGEEVCSTHACGKLFVPGPWVDQIRAHVALAAAKQESAEVARARAEVNRLRRELGLPEVES